MTRLTELLNAITVANPGLSQPLTTDNVAFKDFAELGELTNPVNTQATLTAISGGGFSTSTKIGWGRIDLATLFKNIPISLVEPNAVSTRDLIPTINALYGVGLDANDIQYLNLPTAPTTATVTLVAAETSAYLCGRVQIKFARA